MARAATLGRCLAYNVASLRFFRPPDTMTAVFPFPLFPSPRSVRAGRGRAARALRRVGPELTFKVKGAPAVLSMAVRGRRGD